MELSIVVEGTMFGSPGSMPGKSQSKVLMVGYAVHAGGGIISVLYICFSLSHLNIPHVSALVSSKI